jgi:hypothetical protein
VAWLKRVLGVSVCIGCAGCGTFQLANSVTPNSAKTTDQVQLDTLVCKDRAKTEAETAEKQARAFVLGATLSVIGSGIAYDTEKADQRRVFRDCMEAKGYMVVAATD